MSQNSIEELESLRNVYLFLSEILLREVDSDTVSLLQGESMAGIMESLGVSFNCFEGGLNIIDELASEYSALFIQPGSLPPYESVFLDGRYLAPAADKVEITYQRFGFDYRKTYPSLFPDHAGIELAFMASLLNERIKAVLAGSIAEADAFELEHAAFLLAHPSKWMKDYFAKVSATAQTAFYTRILEFASFFIESEIEEARAVSIPASAGQ